MKLIWKFNLVLLGIFVLGFLIAGYISYRALQANAREEILQNARLMMEAALSSRNYTTTQVKPLLETQMKYKFLPQTVPAYAATEQFNELRKKHPDYTYKEATLNPTNPRNRAPTGRRTSSTSSGTRRRPPRSSANATRRRAGRSTCRGRSRSRARRASTATAPSMPRPRRCSICTATRTASAGRWRR